MPDTNNNPSKAKKRSSGQHNAATASASKPPAQSASQQQQAQQQPQQQLPVLDSVLEYEKLHRIGEGTYGVVYKARHIPTGQIVALKKVRFPEGGKEGLPVTSVRELAILQQAQHPNIVSLLKVATGTRPDSVFLVFEYVEHDLGRVLDSHAPAASYQQTTTAAATNTAGIGGSSSSHRMRPPSLRSSGSFPPTAAAAVAPVGAFSEGEVKCLFKQLLSAVAYLHDKWVLHRDLKLSNLLYSNTGQLKLCDFGLARHFSPDSGRLTPRVVTLWYRAPELLLGADSYGPAVDTWALGCILGELLRGQPLFPASTEGEAIQMHCQLLGTPNSTIWPAMRTLPHTPNIRWPEQPYNYLRRTFPELSQSGLHLLNGLLTYDASKRMSAAEALEHEYFRERPFPRRPADMPSFPTPDAPGFQGQHAAAQHPAAREHIDQVVQAAYAAAGLTRPGDRRAGGAAAGGAAAGGGCYGSVPGGGGGVGEELPSTLYQRYDTSRDDSTAAAGRAGMAAPPAKRPRHSGGF